MAKSHDKVFSYTSSLGDNFTIKSGNGSVALFTEDGTHITAYFAKTHYGIYTVNEAYAEAERLVKEAAEQWSREKICNHDKVYNPKNEAQWICSLCGAEGEDKPLYEQLKFKKLMGGFK